MNFVGDFFVLPNSDYREELEAATPWGPGDALRQVYDDDDDDQCCCCCCVAATLLKCWIPLPLLLASRDDDEDDDLAVNCR